MLLNALLEDGGDCPEEVEWGSLLRGWGAAALRGQWDAMVRSRLHPGMPFARALRVLDGMVRQ